MHHSVSGRARQRLQPRYTDCFAGSTQAPGVGLRSLHIIPVRLGEGSHPLPSSLAGSEFAARLPDGRPRRLERCGVLRTGASSGQTEQPPRSGDCAAEGPRVCGQVQTLQQRMEGAGLRVERAVRAVLLPACHTRMGLCDVSQPRPAGGDPDRMPLSATAEA